MIASKFNFSTFPMFQILKSIAFLKLYVTMLMYSKEFSFRTSHDKNIQIQISKGKKEERRIIFNQSAPVYNFASVVNLSVILNHPKQNFSIKIENYWKYKSGNEVKPNPTLTDF